MSHEKKMTKRDERREMLKLMQARKKSAPERVEQDWVLNFWVNRRGMLT
jgi:uncharacterized protein (UPF0335 family)